MKKLLLIIPAILLLTGCGVAKTEASDGECTGYCTYISKVRYEKDGVTCYVVGTFRGGISCLRDKD